MLEINANASMPTSVKLDVRNQAKMVIDGPPGFSVTLDSRGPDSVYYREVDGSGRPTTGERSMGTLYTTLKRAEFWTPGVAHIDLTAHHDAPPAIASQLPAGWG